MKRRAGQVPVRCYSSVNGGKASSWPGVKLRKLSRVVELGDAQIISRGAVYFSAQQRQGVSLHLTVRTMSQVGRVFWSDGLFRLCNRVLRSNYSLEFRAERVAILLKSCVFNFDVPSRQSNFCRELNPCCPIGSSKIWLVNVSIHSRSQASRNSLICLVTVLAFPAKRLTFPFR